MNGKVSFTSTLIWGTVLGTPEKDPGLIGASPTDTLGVCLFSFPLMYDSQALSCLLPIGAKVSSWFCAPSPIPPAPTARSCLPPNCHASNFLSRLKGHQDSIKLPVHAKPKCSWSRAQSGMLNWILSNQHQLRASH